MPKRKILLIDSDNFWHMLIRRLFSGPDYSLLMTSDTQEGLKLAAEAKPDCILMDFRTVRPACPSISGRRAALPPVIMLSSDPGAGEAARSECGALYFVAKGSPDVARLPAIVEQAVTGK